MLIRFSLFILQQTSSLPKKILLKNVKKHFIFSGLFLKFIFFKLKITTFYMLIGFLLVYYALNFYYFLFHTFISYYYLRYKKYRHVIKLNYFKIRKTF